MDKKKILIVDDEQAILDMYSLKIRNGGFITFTSKTCDEAMIIIREASIDLILLDIMIPIKTGIECLDYIDTDNVKVIMTTNVDSQEIKDIAIKKGAVDYLVKSRETPLSILNRIKEILL